MTVMIVPLSAARRKRPPANKTNTRAHAKNRQCGSADARGQVAEKELTGGNKARVALEVGLDRRLLPDRAEGQEQTKSR
jgi:hypothetical protein